ncbi:hypothetical protein [Chlorogloeopsis fritschii]|uniref:hypothetical protein n=1 Tax=Chlorogloeopsis fritschii TaxID=1124 RepID=UPI0011D04F8F|nr:hypothetical protein [Chlorogloeopsis fritschii]
MPFSTRARGSCSRYQVEPGNEGGGLPLSGCCIGVQDIRLGGEDYHCELRNVKIESSPTNISTANQLQP